MSGNNAQNQQAARRGRAPFSRRGLFSKERQFKQQLWSSRLELQRLISPYTLDSIAVAPMMYSFGDVPDPNPDTVNVMEDLLVDYITSLVSLPELTP